MLDYSRDSTASNFSLLLFLERESFHTFLRTSLEYFWDANGRLLLRSVTLTTFLTAKDLSLCEQKTYWYAIKSLHIQTNHNELDSLNMINSWKILVILWQCDTLMVRNYKSMVVDLWILYSIPQWFLVCLMSLKNNNRNRLYERLLC